MGGVRPGADRLSAAPAAGPLVETGGALRLAVRVTPRAGDNALGGTRIDAAGQAALLVRVTAAPDKGKANLAVRKLLAKALGIAPGLLDLVGGETDRNKQWRIDPAAGLTAAEAARRLGLGDERHDG